MFLKYKIKENDKYISLKQVLKEEFNLSKRLITKLKKAQKILVNNKFTYLDKTLKTNDEVWVILDSVENSSNILPRKMNLNIIYEDEYMLIINKPAGIPVHSSAQHIDDSLSNGVKYYYDSIGLKKLIRPVNRLDRNTSGIVIFAKNEYIQETFIREMENKLFKKEYIAICEGIFNKKEGIIKAPIAREAGTIIKRCVDKNGSNATTKYKVLSEKGGNSKLLVCLETGRTHQIRVHMAYIGHPLLGDDLYGNKSALINRQALHAYKVSFIHPITKKSVEYITDIPTDMVSL